MPILGRDLVFAVNQGSVVTDDPKGLTYTPIAMTTSKALNLSPATVDATSDKSGATTQTMVTRLDAEISATAQIEKKTASSKPITDTIIYLNDQIQAGDQPVLWANLAGQQSPFEVWAWVCITGCNISSNTDEIMTAELTYKPAATDEDVQTWYMEAAV